MANSRKVLLLFGDSKKVTSLAPAGSDPDVLVIREAAKKLFFDGGSGKILVQEYCEDFEDWIDVEEDFVAKDKQKLKIIAPCTAPPLNTGCPSGTQLEPVEDNEAPMESTRLSSVVEVPPMTPVVRCDKDSTLGQVSTTNATPSTPRITTPGSSFTVKRKSQAPLPIPFSLPSNYTPTVMAGLQAGSLSGKAMTKFISEVASAVFHFKSYPTREEKVHVALQCIKKYPFLESSCGTGFGYLVIGLEERLKYLRKPKSSRTRSSEGDQPPPKKAPKPVHPTFVRSVSGIGEDDDSNRRNIKMLQSLAKLTNPDPKSVEDLMARTYGWRRSKLEDTNSSYSIASFLEDFPFLREETQIVADFNRVVEHQDSSFLNSKLRWLDCVPKILKVAERESNPNIVHWLQQRSDTSDEGSDALLSAIILSYLLHDPRTKQDHSRLVQIVPTNSDLAEKAAAFPSSQPTLLAMGNFEDGIRSIHLVLEKRLFLNIRKRTEAVPLLFACHYVFNLVYVHRCHSFFLFLEYLFLKTRLGRKQGPQKLIAVLGL